MATVRIEPFGEVVELREGESVLSAILRSGKFVRYGCKTGGCGACRARLIAGECSLDDRTSFSLSDSDRAEDIVLLCSTRVDGEEATFDVSKLQDLSAEEFHAGLQVREWQAEITEIVAYAATIRCVRMRPCDGGEFEFSAGQYVEIEVPDGENEWRAYSMSSPPQEPSSLEIIVKVIPGGRFSSRLGADIGPGTRLRLRGPLGQFGVRLSHRPMIMIAGGSGLGPIRSMILDLAARDNERPVTLFHGVETPADAFSIAEFRALERSHPWFEFVPVVREIGEDAGWAGEVGLVTEAVTRRFSSFRGFEGYLCGPPGMIDEATALLTAGGCKPRHVYCDRFVASS